jgi:hypothetical protein
VCHVGTPPARCNNIKYGRIMRVIKKGENDGERGPKKMCAAVRVGLGSALCQVV